MNKFLFIAILVANFSFAYELTLNSNITAIKLDENILYIGTDKGEVVSFDTKNKTIKSLFSLPKIKDYYNDSFAKIYSIDILNEKILVLSEGDFGSKNIYWYDNTILKHKKLHNESAKKAFFIDKNTFIVGMRSSELVLFDFDLNIQKTYKFSHSSLNDIALNEEKKFLIAGFESGELELFDIQNWSVFTRFSQIHKDNVYQVDFKGDTIISCGTDRRVGIVKNKMQQFLQRNFLIYTCTLSPSGRLAAFSDDEIASIELFDTTTLQTIKEIPNGNFISQFLVFRDENTLILSDFGNSILIKEL
ncbi:WD40 repeat domain-containing protein [Campylobacter sp. MIT 21-1685]|uniref:WD40 repeat domain-containing protein n=1 Tax=unclassified Campylobacter TaxID=2593542 RepID=UPI00224BA14E|nr:MULTISPECIES: WD40 repeat domain-containing protein [unclassified Campylobacter]MCX2682991.1 WD40 repeat domain-containing protein [Campylobacter sp. MIT 21-1684]MCX2751273.1 WD40 repeat domain-containing protein [Campylobacter sp. MIT 21-1682]MCX2807472.1 WD40 repeat domain-containing protein [Campylobacter sp. MIT 21-1685]